MNEYSKTREVKWYRGNNRFRLCHAGGCKKIPGILYPDGAELAKRSKFVTWRAAVETSSSVEQLALQVPVL